MEHDAGPAVEENVARVDAESSVGVNVDERWECYHVAW